MRRVRLSVAMSLDGYIAGPHGESDWIARDPEFDFRTHFAQFDTVLVGRRTFEAMRRQGRGSIEGMKTFVFSRTLNPAEFPDVTVSSEPAAWISTLKAATGKDIWLFGGGSLFCSLLEMGLVDSVEIALMPVLLGSGLPLTPRLTELANLRLRGHRVYAQSGAVLLDYVPA